MRDLNPATTLRVVEPRLVGPSGHYAEFVRALARRSAGIFAGIEVVTTRRGEEYVPSLGDEVPVVARRLPVGPFAEARAIRAGLIEGKRVLVLTANASHALVADRLLALPRRELQRLSFFVHWPLEKPRERVALAIASRVRRSSLFIAPTDGVHASLALAKCARVQLVGYPALPTAGAPMGSPFRHLLMAGAARLNKGLDLLVGLAERYAIEGRDLPLLVQVSPKHVDRHGSREREALARLLGSGYRGLVADPKAPDRVEYAARYNGAILLAPYDREKFASGVSGVVLDALLHGAPVVTTGGTWAGGTVERFDAGVALAERTPHALAKAIDRILGDWDHYAARAAAASETLAREHDAREIALAVASTGC